MSLSRTTHTGFLSTTSGTSTTTGSYTFASGTVVLVLVAVVNNAGTEDPASLLALTDTGAGLTWTRVAFKDAGGAVDFAPGIAAFVGIGNGTACTLTASKTGNAAGRWYVQPISWTGGDTTTPTGATMAIAPAVASGAASGSLSAAPASTSEVVAGLVGSINNVNAISVTEGAGWTELWDVQSDDWMETEGQVRGSSTSTSVAWVEVNIGGGNAYYRNPVMIAVEIRQASGVATDSAGSGITSRNRPGRGLTGKGQYKIRTDIDVFDLQVPPLPAPQIYYTADRTGTKENRPGRGPYSRGQYLIRGRLDVTAPDGITGALARTLASLTVLGNGTVSVDGSGAQTLGALTASAQGAVSVDGTLARTLAALTVVSSGADAIDGTLTQTLANCAASAAGAVNVDGVLSRALADVTAVSAGAVDISGSLAQLLALLVVAGIGDNGGSSAPSAGRLMRRRGKR